MIFGTSTDRDQAKESWAAAVAQAENTSVLAAELPRQAVRSSNGQETFSTVHRCRYRIGAANRRGGRGKTVNRLIGDELREHRTWDAYRAAYNAMNAIADGQAVFISNQGDAGSVVLNELRAAALEYIDTGVGDERLGLLEWSAPDGSDPLDPHAWAAANPRLGRGMDYDVILGAAQTAARADASPEQLAGFLTEVLCMAVPTLDPAITAQAWNASKEPLQMTEVTGVRTRLAGCVDVSPDLARATLAVAIIDGDARVRVETVRSWTTTERLSALAAMRADLPVLVRQLRIRKLGWFPGGPAAAVDADLRDRRGKDPGRYVWPPRGVSVAELSGADTAAVCMGFSAAVDSDQMRHSGQADLDAQALGASRVRTGDRWVFGRRGAGYVDALYAAAGAAHLARTMPGRSDVSRRFHATPG